MDHLSTFTLDIFLMKHRAVWRQETPTALDKDGTMCRIKQDSIKIAFRVKKGRKEQMLVIKVWDDNRLVKNFSCISENICERLQERALTNLRR